MVGVIGFEPTTPSSRTMEVIAKCLIFPLWPFEIATFCSRWCSVDMGKYSAASEVSTSRADVSANGWRCMNFATRQASAQPARRRSAEWRSTAWQAEGRRARAQRLAFCGKRAHAGGRGAVKPTTQRLYPCRFTGVQGPRARLNGLQRCGFEIPAAAAPHDAAATTPHVPMTMRVDIATAMDLLH
jgi:hypothetical protein